MTLQQKIVSERLTYHFLLTTGEWDIPPGMPFMKEFLNEVKKLCESDQPAPSIPSREEAEREAEEYAKKVTPILSMQMYVKGVYLAGYDWLLSQIGQPGDTFIGVEKSSEIANDSNLLAAYYLLMDAHKFLAKSKLTTDDYGYFSKILVDVKIKLRQLPSPPKQ